MTLYGDTTKWVWLLYGSDTIVGDTHTNTTIDDLDAGEIAKCAVGSTISGTDIPVDTYITVVGVDNITISQAATGTTGDVTLTIQDALYITCEDCTYDIDDTSAKVLDYPSRGHFGWTLQTEKNIAKIKNARTDTEADWNTLKAELQNAKDSTVCNLKKQISSTPTYEKWDGTNTILPVLVKSQKGHKKIYGGDTTIYQIAQIILLQSGAIIA